MFSDDPCSNAQQWVGHAVRATPKGCKLMHFSVTYGTDGSCETACRYSAPSRRPSKKTAADNVAPAAAPANKEAGTKTPSGQRRQKWRAMRRETQLNRLRTAMKALRNASDTEPQDVPEKVASSELDAKDAHATDAAPTQMEEGPHVNGTSLKRQARAGATTAMVLQQQTGAEVHTEMVCTSPVTDNPSHAQPCLTAPNSKRHKSYLEAAVHTTAVMQPPDADVQPLAAYPILTPVNTPNGTRGTFCGSHSITPGGEHAACWMEPEMNATVLEIKELTFHAATN